MKHIVVLTAVLLLTASVSFAQGGSISVDHIDGLWIDDGGAIGSPGISYLTVGPVTYYIRYTNNTGSSVKGMTNGYVINGPASFYPATGEEVEFGSGEYLSDYFSLVHSVATISSDGTGDDQVTFSYSVMGDIGIQNGFDEIVAAIHTGCDNIGETLCLDSMYYPPSGLWLWAPGGVPEWDGPYCYLVTEPLIIPPEITNCPVSAYTGSHCSVVSYNFEATDPEGDPFTWGIVSGVGTINATTGAWSYAPSLADVGSALYVEVAAYDGISGAPSSNTCVYDLAFTNIGPAFTDGCGTTYFSGADMATTVAVTAADGDCDPVTINFVGILPVPEGTVTGTNPVIFTPTINDTGVVYTLTFEATDGVDAATCEAYVDVKGETNFEIMIEKNHGDDYYPYGVIQGQHAFVDVTMNTGSEVPAGFDLLMSYDASALTLQAAVAGAAFYDGGCGWEYFSYRLGASGNCGNACPSGMLRVVGIAETNNGAHHPTCLKPSLPAVMFTLDFLVTNDRTFECQFIPIRFHWLDCGDNSLAYYPLTAQDSVVQGIESSVWNYYSGYGSETVYIQVTSEPTTFPTTFGAPDDCMNPIEDKPDPNRIIDFYNGGIDIICADDIDARGDINLNGESNEIADAVLLSNYFIQGLDVFKVNIDGQIAATDVNADGLTLSVADLVYLIRVIVGDAEPYDKLSTVNVNYTIDNGVVAVDREMGGAFLTVAGDVTPTLLADNMELKYASDGDVTRILVSSLNGNTFNGEFVDVNGQVLSIELASANGSVANLTQMPTSFSLAQNYPNPFNPTTTIGFSMKEAGQYELAIYNVTGQKVATFAGTAEAGNFTIEWDASNEASGVYFYKFSTNNFTDTKKMVLLK
ncbi:MAG TPA: T9SS type A sorting domain-containing protein [candidate division Zixibacteria bacterium]|nr:T9SS type A sorting domain-containing protein [candidate division Zixibacteria bacterium]